MKNLLSELNQELEYDFEGGEGDIEMLEELIDMQEEAANLETYAVESINMCVEMERFEKMGEVIAEHGITTGIAAALGSFDMTEVLANVGGVTIALESLDPDSKNMELGIAANEGFAETARKWVAAIKKFFMDMIAWTKRFFDRWLTVAGRMQAKIGSLKKKASDIKGAKKRDTNLTALPFGAWDKIVKDTGGSFDANLPELSDVLTATKAKLEKEYTTAELSKKFTLDKNVVADSTKNAIKKGTLAQLEWDGSKAMTALDQAESLFKRISEGKAGMKISEAALQQAVRDADAYERMNPTEKEKIELKRKQLSAARLTASFYSRFMSAATRDVIKIASTAVKVAHACIKDSKQKS